MRKPDNGTFAVNWPWPEAHRSSSGCTQRQAVISRVLVRLIMWTGGA